MPAHITLWLGDHNCRLQAINTKKPSESVHLAISECRRLQAKINSVKRPKEGRFSMNIVKIISYAILLLRVPSWTDRILFKIEDPDKISATLRCYESIDDIYSFDHKPVRAQLRFKVSKY
ncbi:hypothetical protein REPUB_Repub02eG0038200 [Reevesia pubescens]